MLSYTIFVQLQLLIVISTHADKCGYVDYCLFVCLLVNLSLCMVTDFSAEDKASGVKFCTMVHGRPGHGISHFWELCSSRSPKSDESAPVLKICSFQKRAPYQRGECPDTLDTPLDPPLSKVLQNPDHAFHRLLLPVSISYLFNSPIGDQLSQNVMDRSSSNFQDG